MRLILTAVGLGPHPMDERGVAEGVGDGGEVTVSVGNQKSSSCCSVASDRFLKAVYFGMPGSCGFQILILTVEIFQEKISQV